MRENSTAQDPAGLRGGSDINSEEKNDMTVKAIRKISAVLMLLVFSFSLAACSESTGSVREKTSESGSRTEESVVIAVDSEPETLDPTQGWGHGNAPVVQSTLVNYTADLTFENDLATDYTLSEDGLTWTFSYPG